jgi:hypothetical protein
VAEVIICILASCKWDTKVTVGGPADTEIVNKAKTSVQTNVFIG